MGIPLLSGSKSLARSSANRIGNVVLDFDYDRGDLNKWCNDNYS